MSKYLALAKSAQKAQEASETSEAGALLTLSELSEQHLKSETCPNCGLQGSPARPNGWFCPGEGKNGEPGWKPGCLARWGQDPPDPSAPPDEPCRHGTTSTTGGISTCLRCQQSWPAVPVSAGAIDLVPWPRTANHAAARGVAATQRPGQL